MPFPSLSETVDRQDHRRLARVDCRVDCPANGRVVRTVEAIETFLPLFDAEPDIAGNYEPVGDLHNERRIIKAAIWVDEKSRELADDCRCAQHFGKGLGHALGAEIECNMPVQILRSHAKCMEILGNPVLRMIAKEQKAELYIPVNGPVWLGQIFL